MDSHSFRHVLFCLVNSFCSLFITLVTVYMPGYLLQGRRAPGASRIEDDSGAQFLYNEIYWIEIHIFAGFNELARPKTLMRWNVNR